ncbi:MAG: HEAT repeat domain-containing protein [Nitrospira sp. BO4]|jgi:HEAT repeat protein|nr:HEAT repeat domain-containing protein [Nitrospira sp. BO4]
MRDNFTQDQLVAILSFAFSHSDPEIARVGLEMLPHEDRSARVLLCRVLRIYRPEELIGAQGKPLWKAIKVAKFFEYIGRHGRVGLLRSMLRHQAEGIRWAVIEALGRLDETSAVDVISRALSDSAENVRAVAKRVLEKLHRIQHGALDIDKKEATASPTLFPLSTRERGILDLVAGRIPNSIDPTTALELLCHPVSEIREMVGELDWARSSDRDAVVAAMASTKISVTQELLQFLGELGDTRLVAYIAPSLGRVSALDRAAIDALARIGDASSIEQLVLTLRRTSKSEEARAALMRLGDAATPSLLAAYCNDPYIRRHEAELVSRVAGPAALTVLLEALEDRNLAVRENAEKGLESIGECAIDPLLDRLASDNPTIRHHAICVLGKLQEPRALNSILRMASEGNAHDRWVGIWGVSAFPANDRSLALLSNELSASGWETRTHVVKSLGNFRLMGQVANGIWIVSLLAASLKDSKSAVRRQAVTSLCALGVHLEDLELRRNIVEALVQVLRSEENELKQAAISALTHIGKMTLEPLQRARETANKSARPLLEEIISEIRPRSSFTLASRSSFSRTSRTSPTSIPGRITDDVQFSVMAPRTLTPGEAFILEIWAHLECSRETLMKYARESYGSGYYRIRSRGPIQVERGTTMRVRLQIPGFGLSNLEDIIHWGGAMGNCPLPVTVPRETKPGTYFGLLRVFVEDLHITTVHFELEVSATRHGMDDIVTRIHKIKSAFASYASENRNEVLGRIQGMLKILPDLDVFLDVASLRSGEKWESRLQEEIVARDVLYLFWSLAASQSTWVEREWRTALAMKGMDFIAPVPLESPAKVPPPPELACLHFNEWTLAYRSNSSV